MWCTSVVSSRARSFNKACRARGASVSSGPSPQPVTDCERRVGGGEADSCADTRKNATAPTSCRACRLRLSAAAALSSTRAGFCWVTCHAVGVGAHHRPAEQQRPHHAGSAHGQHHDQAERGGLAGALGRLAGGVCTGLGDQLCGFVQQLRRLPVHALHRLVPGLWVVVCCLKGFVALVRSSALRRFRTPQVPGSAAVCRTGPHPTTAAAPPERRGGA